MNLSRDGKLAVAAYGDGTIRWHDVEHEGRELLAFFPHADRKRWVLWANTDSEEGEKDMKAPVELPGTYASEGGKPGVFIVAASDEMKNAGVGENDTVLAVEDRPIADISTFSKAIQSVEDGSDVRLTIRTRTGERSLTLKAQRPWIPGTLKMRTNGAYFTCSEGAEDLIGWHLNRGENKEAEFFPAEQLWANFYRPDIVQRVLEDRRPAGEIAKELGIVFNLEAALARVPVVALTGVKDGETAGTDTLEVTIEARDTGGGLRDVQLFHNGKRVPPDGPGNRRGEVRAQGFTVTLAPGENELKAQEANDAQTMSKPAIAKVKFNGVQATSALHVLTVGLNRYVNPKYNLTYCVPDAEATAKAFQKRAGGLFSEVKLYSLADDQATKANFAAKFAELAKVVKPNDLFVFAYAGHGVMGDPAKPGDDPMFFLVPHDVTRLYGDPEMLAEKGVSRKDLEDWCAKVPARKQLMLLDTCQSGGLVNTFAMRGAAEEKAIAQLARSTGTMVIASTGAEAYARESKEIGHGIFTQALLDGLADGKADANKDGKITVKEVEAYINEAVPELSKKLTNAPQFPTSYARGQDFPIGIVK